MSVSEELLEILVCPETKQPVKPADASILERLNAQVQAGTLRNRGGESVTNQITGFIEGLFKGGTTADAGTIQLNAASVVTAGSVAVMGFS